MRRILDHGDEGNIEIARRQTDGTMANIYIYI